MASEQTFVDVFAGCGGLSLGLMRAGWHGVFAVEKEENAFATLSHNLLGPGKRATGYSWPAWLPQAAHSIEALLAKHEAELRALKGKVTLLAGAPPCQGFSTIGRRIETDPRNQAFRKYIKLVELLNPRLVLLENVRGIDQPFRKNGVSDREGRQETYASMLRSSLEALQYQVWSSVVYARDFGVPQIRPRFILIAYRLHNPDERVIANPFTILGKLQPGFLADLRLKSPVTIKQALSDLETNGGDFVQCVDSPRFLQGAYGVQRSTYAKLMHGELNGALPNSHRLARHAPETTEKFQWFLDHCPKGKKLEQVERGKYANRKHTVYILDPEKPAPTITTLPDDLLHYAEPRILTVREMARLQSFPDWFEFKGKYTTGGTLRVKECPRYTQVGNAVPPLLAEAIGEALIEFLNEIHDQ